MKKSYFLVAFLSLFEFLDVYILASPSTAPAFLWFPHHNQLQSGNVLNYQTISPKDLAKSVFSQGGWSDLLCSGQQSPQSVDVALVFVGRKLESSHVAGNKPADSALVDLLKVSFTRSNFSMAFPYVAAPGEETMESVLASEFMEACGDNLRINNVAFSESCSVEGGNFQKLADLHSVQDYLLSRMEKKTEGKADLVVFCYDGTESMNQLDQPRPESEVISGLINSVEQLGAEYTVLYVSDPVRSIQNPTYRELERFLADGAGGNGSANSTGCDQVCKFKSSLLEGILVAIVLLLILISGLCCMMGIDTPTRFEAPHES
ncbi:uncharacterized protein LOC123198782 [Mangifera indica]|uniref:uncharacterized protein LOC123198782 n=1 Tax=Mangifera indica TaxID=29780 RepID=UPI001CFBC438|nr:uncharacterized protein LOC123198782 [Mangifera indica]XP_044469498.1 uncharacterized protein LOC123198782 [Mangifera indica]XP_044469501.1 uncharacterized protein LOC123198782 [Mangifera indica]